MLADVQRLKREQITHTRHLVEVRDRHDQAQYDFDRAQEALYYIARNRGTTGPLIDQATRAYDEAEREVRELRAELDTLRQRYAVETQPVDDNSSHTPLERRVADLVRRMTDLERRANQPGGPR